MCTIASGASIGTCAAAPTGPAHCGVVDGVVCTGCGECCSRLCAPYGPTGVKICQPASGCHVDGDLCREDRDCCGAAGTGLPGDGNVVCDKETGAPVGICRNPTGCNPEGNVCHFKDYVCGGSSARNACCAAVGNSGVCQLDPIGIPRCYGLGTDCRETGETCASSMDCCGGVPCVVAPDGLLRCLPPSDGGPTCVPSGGSCTINGDCCPGTVCIREPGSVQGVCGTTTPPGTGGTPGSGGTPATGGTPGSGGTATGGVPTAGSGGAGGVPLTGGAPATGGVPPATGGIPATGGVPPATGGTPATGGSPPCSEYGQLCTTRADCCNGVPCYLRMCVIPPG
jgi:hypothetical protein